MAKYTLIKAQPLYSGGHKLPRILRDSKPYVGLFRPQYDENGNRLIVRLTLRELEKVGRRIVKLLNDAEKS